MPIIITSREESVAEALKSTAPPGVSVEVKTRFFRGADFNALAVTTLTFIRDAAIALEPNLVAAWIISKVKDDPSCQISDGRKDIEKSELPIRRRIEEDLEIGRND